MTIKHILLAAVSIGILSTTVAAQPEQEEQSNTMSPEQALERDAQNYARSYNVALPEAKRRVAIMANAGDEVAAIETAEGAALSGVYFDHDNGFQLVVRTTGKKSGKQKVRVKEMVSPSGKEHDLDVNYVPDGKVSRRVARLFMKDNKKSLQAVFPNLQSFGYEDRSGEVYLLLKGVPGTESTYEAQRLDLEKRFKVPVRIDVHAGEVGTTPMRGGSPIVRPGSTAHFCTTAFAAKGPAPDYVVGMLTAGHCHGPTAWREGGKEYILTNTSTFNAFEDWGFLTGFPSVAEFFAESGTVARKLTGRRTKANTDERETTPNATAVVGSYVCFYGMTTAPINGQECGEVWSTYSNPNYQAPKQPNGCSNGPTFVSCATNFVEVRPAKGEIMNCRGGDSGSPWFIYTTAFGIMSGCGWPDPNSASASRAFYTSTDELDYSAYSLVYAS